MEEKNKSQKNNIMKFLSDWGLLIVSLIIIVAYTVLTTTQIKSEELNIWNNILFVVLNLLAAFYISRQVSMWGWLTENSANQKKIAKTAIRHCKLPCFSDHSKVEFPIKVSAINLQEI